MNSAFDAAHTVGMSKWDLDTPALCVDVDKLERNLRTVQRRCAQHGIACRPHAKTHKCPAIATLQIASGAVGICAAKVSEAEVFAAHGIDRILMTTANPHAGQDSARHGGHGSRTRSSSRQSTWPRTRGTCPTPRGKRA